PHAGSQLASLVQDKRIIISEFLVVVGHLSNPFKGLDLVKYESKGPLTIGELFRFPVPKNDRKYNWGAKNLMVVNDEISGSYNPYETNFIEKINSDDNLKEFEKAKVPIHAITTNFSACELHSSLCTGEIMSYLPRKKGKAAIAKAILKVLIKEALPRGVDSFMEYIFKSNDKDKGEKNDFIVPQSSMQAGLGEKYISRFSGKNIMHTDPSFSKIENFILKDLIGVKVSGVMGDSQVHDKIGSLLRQNPNSNTSNFTTKLSPPELTYNFLSGFSGFANKSASFSDLKGKLFINPDSFTELTSGKQTTFDVYQEDLDEMIVACEFPDLDIMYLETRDKGELAYKNSYTVEIPEEAFGKVIITAYGFREGKLEVMHTIEPEVKLPQGVSLQSIRFTEESGSVSEQTTYHYDLLGTFSDGVERRINDMEGIKYTISDTSILEQIDNETVKGLAKGKATLTASINSLKAELILEVVENPVLSSTIVTDFYAECEDDGSVIVKWNTYNEYQTKKFVLERSEDNDQNFVEINQQQAKGISHDPVSYSYTDNPTGKKVFYKLTLYNTEDKILYSQIIEVNREEGGLAVEENLPAGAVKDKNRIYVSPNPLTEASGNLFVHSDSNDAAASLNIYDLTGKLTFTKKYAITQGEQKITFTLPSEISNGVYILQLKTNHFTKSVKLILKR
ncbi:MAG: T9SS type A sorting domain-containing protein, partial [Flavobacteriaceae bacterium]|nr:T9SS type A sorting domain-containing protein [Flavobacteriaceae bacterium]